MAYTNNTNLTGVQYKAGTMSPANPEAFGTVFADDISGHRRVQSKTDLYEIPTAILTKPHIADGIDAIGQEWYVSDERCRYQLTDWSNRKNANGWKEVDSFNNTELGNTFWKLDGSNVTKTIVSNVLHKLDTFPTSDNITDNTEFYMHSNENTSLKINASKIWTYINTKSDSTYIKLDLKNIEASKVVDILHKVPTLSSDISINKTLASNAKILLDAPDGFYWTTFDKLITGYNLEDTFIKTNGANGTEVGTSNLLKKLMLLADNQILSDRHEIPIITDRLSYRIKYKTLVSNLITKFDTLYTKKGDIYNSLLNIELMYDNYPEYLLGKVTYEGAERLAWINTDSFDAKFLRLDGVNSMNADLNFGGNKAVNIGAINCNENFNLNFRDYLNFNISSDYVLQLSKTVANFNKVKILNVPELTNQENLTIKSNTGGIIFNIGSNTIAKINSNGLNLNNKNLQNVRIINSNNILGYHARTGHEFYINSVRAFDINTLVKTYLDLDLNNKKIINFASLEGTGNISFKTTGNQIFNFGTNSNRSVIFSDLGVTTNTSITATNFRITNGTANQILLANGTTMDKSSIISSEDYLPLTGGTLTGPLDMSNKNLSNINNIYSNSTSLIHHISSGNAFDIYVGSTLVTKITSSKAKFLTVEAVKLINADNNSELFLMSDGSTKSFSTVLTNYGHERYFNISKWNNYENNTCRLSNTSCRCNYLTNSWGPNTSNNNWVKLSVQGYHCDIGNAVLVIETFNKTSRYNLDWFLDTRTTENQIVKGYVIFNKGAGKGSDIRYKKNTKKIGLILNKLRKMPIFTYDWCRESDPEYHSLGTSAQWVNKYFPEIVHYDKDKDLYTLEEDKLGILAVKCIQEEVNLREQYQRKTDRRLDRLEAQVKQLMTA